MARWGIVIGVTALAAGLAAPVAAQSVDEDVRCLLASNVIVRQEKDPTKRQLATASQLFYFGRLDARISTPALKTALAAQIKTMTGASIGPTMTACVKRLAAKGVAMQTLNLQDGSPPPKPK